MSNSHNQELLLMSKINMIEELLDKQEWNPEFFQSLRAKAAEYREKLAILIIKEKL